MFNRQQEGRRRKKITCDRGDETCCTYLYGQILNRKFQMSLSSHIDINVGSEVSGFLKELFKVNVSNDLMILHKLCPLRVGKKKEASREFYISLRIKSCVTIMTTTTNRVRASRVGLSACSQFNEKKRSRKQKVERKEGRKEEHLR